MKTSRKQLLRYCALPFATILLAGASTSDKNEAVTIQRFTQPFTKDTYHPKYCSYDLVTHLHYTTAQIKTEDDVSYAKTPAIHKDVTYPADTGDGKLCNLLSLSCDTLDYSAENSLRYKIYYPDSALHDYNLMPLPLIILFHPGGFSECPDYDVELMNVLCDEFSRRGFIVLNVEYRRGKIQDRHIYTSVQDELATYRGQQDGRGVIRSIIKKQKNDITNGNWKYIFDTTQVFVGGASAGGVIAMSCAYYKNQSMVDTVNPHDPSSLPISNNNILGPQNADYYSGGTGSQNWPRIAGVLSMWGGIPIPKSYDNYEDSFFTGGGTINVNTPLITFSGVKDKVVYFEDDDRQDVKFSIAPEPGGINYRSDSTCLNTDAYYTVSSYATPPGVLVKRCSGLNMYNVLKKLGVYTEIYYDCSMKHGLGNGADFGIGTSNTVAVTKYIAQRTAIFFQTIMNYGSVPVPFGYTSRSVFRDCRNYRNSCSLLTDAPSCINDTANYEICTSIEE